MSNNSFENFMEKLQQDGALQQELRDKLGDPAQGIPVADLARFATGKGYEFKVEELGGEMSDEQLGAVAGGAAFDAFSPIYYKFYSPTQDTLYIQYTDSFKKFY